MAISSPNSSAKRSTNAALGATDLSGNDIGNIIATDATPKTRPAAIPSRTLDIVWAVLFGFSPWPAIARETAAYVIAEGIENVEMFDLVRQMGVQGVQGYLLGRPSETLPDTSALEGLGPLAQIS